MSIIRNAMINPYMATASPSATNIIDLPNDLGSSATAPIAAGAPAARAIPAPTAASPMAIAAPIKPRPVAIPAPELADAAAVSLSAATSETAAAVAVVSFPVLSAA